eukprot:Rhum_TRINITY_DN12308_c0_g1::Rhum_TRINITY_DN12308_c0_g1_i1::g.50894::m.50894
MEPQPQPQQQPPPTTRTVPPSVAVAARSLNASPPNSRGGRSPISTPKSHAGAAAAGGGGGGDSAAVVRQSRQSLGDLAVVQYHYSLRMMCLGCLIGTGIRFGHKGEGDKYHFHTPRAGALWVVCCALAGLLLSFFFVATDVLKKPVAVKAKQLMLSKTQRSLDYLAPPFMIFGVVSGGLSTKDLGWAVADGCSCLALIFTVWGIWAFVSAMENCMGDRKLRKQPKNMVSVEVPDKRQQRHRTLPRPVIPQQSLQPKRTNPLNFTGVCSH